MLAVCSIISCIIGNIITNNYIMIIITTTDARGCVAGWRRPALALARHPDGVSRRRLDVTHCRDLT